MSFAFVVTSQASLDCQNISYEMPSGVHGRDGPLPPDPIVSVSPPTTFISLSHLIPSRGPLLFLSRLSFSTQIDPSTYANPVTLNECRSTSVFAAVECLRSQHF